MQSPWDDGPGLYDQMPDPNSSDGPAWCQANERAQLAISRLDTDWEAAEIKSRGRDGKQFGITEAEARQYVREDAREKLPRVSTVLGLRATWPVTVGEGEDAHRWTPHDGPCPACGGESMDVMTCCVVYDAWGLDRVFERIGYDADVATVLGYPEAAPDERLAPTGRAGTGAASPVRRDRQ